MKILMSFFFLYILATDVFALPRKDDREARRDERRQEYLDNLTVNNYIGSLQQNKKDGIDEFADSIEKYFKANAWCIEQNGFETAGYENCLNNENLEPGSLPDQEKEYNKAHFRSEVYTYLDSFYADGLITQNHLNEAIAQFENIALTPENFHRIAVAMKDKLHRDELPSCANESDQALGSVRYCCTPQQARLPHYNYKEVYLDGGGSCKIQNESCSSHNDCCSSYCDGLMESSVEGLGTGVGTCMVPKICMVPNQLNEDCTQRNPYCQAGQCITQADASSDNLLCREVGARCRDGNDCCSGQCNANICAGNSKCTQCAAVGQTPDPSNNLNCCPGLYKGLMGVCINAVPSFFSTDTDRPQKNILQIIAELVIPSSKAAETTQIDQGNIDALKLAREKCLDDYPSENQTQMRDDCMQQAMNIARIDPVVSAETISTQNDYVKQYDAKNLEGVSDSNIKSCEFNSFKDNWIDATFRGKNAEITLRAFEMMFQGEAISSGVNDLKDKIIINISPNSQGMSLYEHLKRVADILKKNRKELILSLHKDDLELTCKCIKAVGVDGVSPEKAQLFSTKCVSAKIIESPKLLTNEQQHEKTTDEASGVLLTQFLIEFLDYRLAAAQRRFRMNEQAESELYKIIEAYNGINWGDTQEKWIELGHNDDGSSRNLRVWKRGGFALALASIFAPFLYIRGSEFGGGIRDARMERHLAKIITSNNDGLEPWYDEDLGDWSYCKWAKRCKSYKRWLTPDYWKDPGINTSAAGPGCEVYSNRSGCIKTMYGVSLDKKYTSASGQGDYEFVMEYYTSRVLLDPWLPKFFPTSAAFRPFRNAEQFMTARFNRGYENGQNYLEENFPTKKKKVSYLGLDPVQGNISKFIPDTADMFDSEGSLNTRFQFGQDKINTFKCAVIRYASCGWLGGCGSSVAITETSGNPNMESCYAPVTSYQNLEENSMGALENSDLGFYKLFATADTEANFKKNIETFAEYVYQMHFLWPNISSSDLKYPKMGMASYLDAIFHSVYILGSNNISDLISLDQLRGAYENDLMRRKAVYDDTNGTAEGNPSVNVSPSNQIYSAFKRIDFATGTVPNLPSSNVSANAGVSNRSLGSGALSTIQSGVNHALRQKKMLEERENFIKNAGINLNSKGNQAFKSQTDQIASPLQTIMKSSPLASQVKGMSNAMANSTTKRNQMAVRPSRSSNTSSSSGGGYDSEQFNFESGSSTGDVVKHGLSDVAVKHILNEAHKDRSIRNVNGSDTLFTIVSKAYKRNLFRVLEVRNQKRPEIKTIPPTTIDQKSKQKLKELLQVTK